VKQSDSRIPYDKKWEQQERERERERETERENVTVSQIRLRKEARFRNTVLLSTWLQQAHHEGMHFVALEENCLDLFVVWHTQGFSFSFMCKSVSVLLSSSL
jgi:hypothetical protein